METDAPKDQDIKSKNTYRLRLPRSIKAEVEPRAKKDGIGINQFVATVVTEKLAAMRTAEFFAERCLRDDFAAFDRLMQHAGAAPPERCSEMTLIASCVRHKLRIRKHVQAAFYSGYPN